MQEARCLDRKDAIDDVDGTVSTLVVGREKVALNTITDDRRPVEAPIKKAMRTTFQPYFFAFKEDGECIIEEWLLVVYSLAS